MNTSHSDALVFFGATGDLAYKKIFPALQAMAKRGNLTAPVIGVGRSDWTVDQLRTRARESLEKHGGIDTEAFGRLAGLLRYVSVNYTDPMTFQTLRTALGGAHRPAYYLAIRPDVGAGATEPDGQRDDPHGRRRSPPRKPRRARAR